MLVLLSAASFLGIGSEAQIVLAVACFILGLILCVIEMFMPGFGVAGISGTILLFVGVLLKAENLTEGIALALGVLIILGIMAFMSVRSLTRGALSRSPIVLSASTEDFNSVPDLTDLLDREGVACSTLRPAGIAEIGSKRVDVVTEGEFIKAGAPVRVTQVTGMRVVVQEITQ